MDFTYMIVSDAACRLAAISRECAVTVDNEALKVWGWKASEPVASLPLVDQPRLMAMYDDLLLVVTDRVACMCSVDEIIAGKSDPSQWAVFMDDQQFPALSDVSASCFSADGRYAVLLCKSDGVVYDRESHCVAFLQAYRGKPDFVVGCFFGSLLVTGTAAGDLLIWNAEDGTLVSDLGIIRAASTPTAITVDAINARIIVGFSDGVVLFLSVQPERNFSGSTVVHTVSCEKYVAEAGRESATAPVVYDVAFVGRELVIVSTLCALAVDCDSLAVLASFFYSSACTFACISPSGTTLVVYGFDQALGWLSVRHPKDVSVDLDLTKDHVGVDDTTEEKKIIMSEEVDLVVAVEPLSDELRAPLQRPKQRKDSLQDKPVTFHKQIKSSGYNNSNNVPWSVQQQRKEKARLLQKKQQQQQRQKQQSPDMGSPVVAYPEPPVVATNPMEAVNAVLDKNALHEGPIACLAFGPEGQYLASGSQDKTVQCMKFPIGRKGDSCCCKGHKSIVSCLDTNLSAANPLLLSGSFDASFALWSPGKRETPVLQYSTSKDVKAVRFYYLDTFLAVSCGPTVALHKYYVDTSVDDLKRLKNESIAVESAKFTWDAVQAVTAFDCYNCFASNVMVVAGSNKTVVLYDVASQAIRQHYDTAHQRQVHSVAVHRSSRYASPSTADLHMFATAACDGTARLWDMRVTAPTRTLANHVNSSVKVGLALSPCGTYVTCGSEDRAAYVYDRRMGGVVHKYTMPDVVSAVAYHPCQAQVALATHGGHLKLFAA